MAFTRREVVAALGAVGDGDATLRLGILLADHAAELLGDVLHQNLIEWTAGVELAARRGEGIVGIAAGGHEVIRDNGILRVQVEGFAVDAVDDHALDAVRAIVGRAGIFVGVRIVGLVGKDGEVDTGHLRESADRAGRAEGGGLERLEQLRAGHIDHGHGVAEGQDGVDVPSWRCRPGGSTRGCRRRW